MTEIEDKGSRKVERALISVHNKTGLAGLARRLAELGVEILSTGGTADAIRAEGVGVREMSELTGFRELLGGRVKSLHPAVHAGVLARDDVAGDIAELAAHGIDRIDLVVVNLYPFGNRPSGSTVAEATEFIDIGGPALVRAAAKNHARVAAVTDPKDYTELLSELESGGGSTSLGYRQDLAARAFSLTAGYDAAIAEWMHGLAGNDVPERVLIGGWDGRRLPYGENPHQGATFHSVGPPGRGLGSARQWSGKPPGFNNLLDADAAASLASEFEEDLHAACVIVKHGTPCGAAVAQSTAEAFERAWSSDPVSAFGGAVALNRPLDSGTAARIADRFVEVVIAPSLSEEAIGILRARPGLRILECRVSGVADGGREFRSVSGGILVQQPDGSRFDPGAFRVVTKRVPTAKEWKDLEFAWKVAKHAKSNAIVLAAGGGAVGIGTGQTSRVAAAGMASANLREHHAGTEGVVAASDGFFPFADGIEALAEAGAVAVIQPGGSRNDAEIIGAADALGLAMVVTGIRSFRH